jgi:acetyl-CoA synthetase
LPSPERAVRAWRALWQARPRRHHRAPSRRDLPPDVAQALAMTSGPLPYTLARHTLEAYGVRFCPEAVVATADAAVGAADGFGYPVVVKADAAGLVHKTDAGGVRLDLGDAGAVRRACANLAARFGKVRFVVQPRVGPGVELLFGARRDEVFGPVVLAGVGGVLAEVLQDFSLALAPLDPEDAAVMLREGVRARLLAGPRGLPACDEAPLVDLLLALSDAMLSEPRISEIDLNPVIAFGSHAVAVDAVVIAG